MIEPKHEFSGPKLENENIGAHYQIWLKMRKWVFSYLSYFLEICGVYFQVGVKRKYKMKIIL